MSQSPDIKAIVHPFFDQLCDHVRSRRSNQDLVGWIIRSPKQFMPGYTMLSQLGNHWWQRVLNRVISRCVPGLWPRWFGRAIYQASVPAWSMLYDRLSPEQALFRDRYHEYLRSYIGTVSSVIRYATFGELVRTLNQCSQAWLEAAELSPNLFADVKDQQNQACTEIYASIRDEFLAHDQSLLLGMSLSLMGNWFDILNRSHGEFEQQFKGLINTLFDDLSTLSIENTSNPLFTPTRACQFLSTGPKHLIYHCDNAGEVIMDLLLIECLLKQGHRVSLVAKPAPVLNDITLSDLSDLLAQPSFSHLKAYETNNQFKTYSLSTAFPTQSLAMAPKGYQDLIQTGDLIILKGQANFDGYPIGDMRLGKFRPIQYKSPILYITGIRAQMTKAATAPFFRHHRNGEPFRHVLYFYDASDPSTYPIYRKVSTGLTGV